MYIPLSKQPSGLQEIEVMVAATFNDLNLPQPRIRLAPDPVSTVSDGYFILEGNGPDDFCRAHVDRMPEGVTEDKLRPFMATVTTKGDWRFAGAIALAFCRFGGGCVFNDSGELDGTLIYDESALRLALVAALAGLPSDVSDPSHSHVDAFQRTSGSIRTQVLQ